MRLAELEARLAQLERQWWMIGYTMIGVLLAMAAISVSFAALAADEAPRTSVPSIAPARLQTSPDRR